VPPPNNRTLPIYPDIDQKMKLQHWCGFSGIFARQAAPIGVPHLFCAVFA
jgi:hypothetical protein